MSCSKCSRFCNQNDRLVTRDELWAGRRSLTSSTAIVTNWFRELEAKVAVN